MASLPEVRSQLHSLATTLDRNQNGSLAHQEISQAEEVPSEAKKVLSQATSRAANSAGGQSVENVQRWVDTFVADFEQFDTDGSGRLSQEEVARADPFRQQGQLQAMQRLLDSDWLASAGEPVVCGGKSFSEMLDGVKVESEKRLTPGGEVDPILAQQLIQACHQSTYGDVDSVKKAFDAVDGGEFVVRAFSDPGTGKRYVAVDYGAGDSTYGAIFEEGSTEVALSIHDGDLEQR